MRRWVLFIITHVQVKAVLGGRVDELALPRPGRHAADHLPVHHWASGEPGPDYLSSGHF